MTPEQRQRAMTPEQMQSSMRRRIMMFYFAAGANIVMALLVLSAGAGTAGLAAMAVFVVFAVLQFYMARNMQKRWNAQMHQMRSQPPGNSTTR